MENLNRPQDSAAPAPGDVRVAGPADAAALQALYERCFEPSWKHAYAPDILKGMLPLACEPQEDLMLSGTYFAIDEINETGAASIVGCGGWTPHSFSRPDHIVAGEGHVRHFAVDPDLQGTGVGRRILETTLASAEANGATILHLTASLTAVGFYETFGFQCVEEAELPVGGVLFPVVAMTRS